MSKIVNGETLLIVDDDRSTRGLVRGVLSRQGYTVIEAADGSEAVAQFQRQHPVLILMDVMMPVMDGFTACAAIRELENTDSTAIIMLTADDDLGAIDRAFDVGATDFILKPINWSLLTQRIRYALRACHLNRALRQSHIRETSARRLSKLVFWEWNLTTDTLCWLDQLEHVFHVSLPLPQTMIDFLGLVHADDRARVTRSLDFIRQDGTVLDVEVRLQFDSKEHLVRLLGERGTELREHNYIFGVLQDVTDLRRTEALVDYLALHDELTDLPNRRLFMRHINTALQQLNPDASVLVIAWIDLTRFHRHNEALGDELGNLLLRHFAGRLCHLVVAPDAVARVGGDEFALLVRAHEHQEAINRLESLLIRLRQPYQLGTREVILGCSAGLAIAPDNGTDAQQLLAQAQQAQRFARSQALPMAQATHHLYEHDSTHEALEFERQLHRALERDEFFLVYQPQMALRSGKIIGVEALLRWKHPQFGTVSPIKFIPLLEDLGLIGAVGDWVLQTAMQQSAAWAAAGLQLRVGINLSPRQFIDDSLLQRLTELLTMTRANVSNIELEITESLAMHNPDQAIALLHALREQGFKIAIDDFGIGHSSLEYLLRFPIDTIKIDRAFVTHITRTVQDRAIVRSVTVLGQTLGLSVIAEGVETLRQCDFLEALEVNEIQGYLIGKPMAPEAIEHLLQDFTRPGMERDQP